VFSKDANTMSFDIVFFNLLRQNVKLPLLLFGQIASYYGLNHWINALWRAHPCFEGSRR